MRDTKIILMEYHSAILNRELEKMSSELYNKKTIYMVTDGSHIEPPRTLSQTFFFNVKRNPTQVTKIILSD